MAITLLDTARQKKDLFERAVVETFAFGADLTKVLPLETTGTLEVKDQRTNSIPDVGWRKRHESFGSIKGGGTDDVADSVYSMGGAIDIDKADMRDKKLSQNPLTTRIQGAIKGMTWKFNDAAINGDHATDEDMPEGIKVRLALAGSTQTLYAGDSSNDLDVYGDFAAGTTTTLQTFLDKIDEARALCDGNTADICITRREGINAIKGTLRRLNLYKNAEPTQPYVKTSTRRSSNVPFNTPVFEWDGIKFFEMGVGRDQSTQLIANDTIGSEPCAPFYFLKLGFPYFHGIQQYAMEVTKPFMLDNGVTWRTIIDWPVGFHHVHDKFASVLRGVRTAA